MSATAQIRVGIIGTGVHGSRYARHLLGREVDGLELSVISRRSVAGSAQAGEWGVGYHRDWRDLVADRCVDAVIAAVTPDLNPEIADIALLPGNRSLSKNLWPWTPALPA